MRVLLQADLRDVLGEFGEIDMVNSRHIASGGFAFVFYTTNEAAARALEKPRITIKGKMVNVLAKKQIVHPLLTSACRVFR